MRLTSLAICMLLLFSCQEKKATVSLDYNNLQHRCVKDLTDAIVFDIFSPPVAARIYAYTNLAYYEALRYGTDKAQSITAQLKDFKPMPAPVAGKKYDFNLAAVRAFYKVGTSFIFTKDSIKAAENELLKTFESQLDEEVYNNSVQLGDTIGSIILARAVKDNYRETRGMPKYNVIKEEGKWRQTSPDYADAAEPHWAKMKTFLLDSATHFKLPPPPAYSLSKGSKYYDELMELYNTSKLMTPAQDTIARYWDDNPFVTQHDGHLMYANKKTTPGGHWQGIAGIVASQEKKDAYTTARAYALMSTAMFDAFVACWAEKFASRTIRPISVIQDNIEPEWNPLLQTPPFPEYTSGHSTISAAAATILTGIIGDSIEFEDTTELEYLGLKRSFPSLRAAAQEVSISRLYGGIHFRSALENGFKQGEEIGQLYLERVR